MSIWAIWYADFAQNRIIVTFSIEGLIQSVVIYLLYPTVFYDHFDNDLIVKFYWMCSWSSIAILSVSPLWSIFRFLLNKLLYSDIFLTRCCCFAYKQWRSTKKAQLRPCYKFYFLKPTWDNQWLEQKFTSQLHECTRRK